MDTATVVTFALGCAVFPSLLIAVVALVLRATLAACPEATARALAEITRDLNTLAETMRWYRVTSGAIRTRTAHSVRREYEFLKRAQHLLREDYVELEHSYRELKRIPKVFGLLSTPWRAKYQIELRNTAQQTLERSAAFAAAWHADRLAADAGLERADERIYRKALRLYVLAKQARDHGLAQLSRDNQLQGAETTRMHVAIDAALSALEDLPAEFRRQMDAASIRNLRAVDLDRAADLSARHERRLRAAVAQVDEWFTRLKLLTAEAQRLSSVHEAADGVVKRAASVTADAKVDMVWDGITLGVVRINEALIRLEPQTMPVLIERCQTLELEIDRLHHEARQVVDGATFVSQLTQRHLAELTDAQALLDELRMYDSRNWDRSLNAATLAHDITVLRRNCADLAAPATRTWADWQSQALLVATCKTGIASLSRKTVNCAAALDALKKATVTCAARIDAVQKQLTAMAAAWPNERPLWRSITTGAKLHAQLDVMRQGSGILARIDKRIDQWTVASERMAGQLFKDKRAAAARALQNLKLTLQSVKAVARFRQVAAVTEAARLTSQPVDDSAAAPEGWANLTAACASLAGQVREMQTCRETLLKLLAALKPLREAWDKARNENAAAQLRLEATLNAVEDWLEVDPQRQRRDALAADLEAARGALAHTDVVEQAELNIQRVLTATQRQTAFMLNIDEACSDLIGLKADVGKRIGSLRDQLQRSPDDALQRLIEEHEKQLLRARLKFDSARIALLDLRNALQSASASHTTAIRRKRDPHDIGGRVMDVRTTFNSLDRKRPHMDKIGRCISDMEAEVQLYTNIDREELHEITQRALSLLIPAERSSSSQAHNSGLMRLRRRLHALDDVLAAPSVHVDRHERAVPLYFVADHA